VNASFATSVDSPWPHRLAVLLVCATFPLIWVGGLVTTGDAGMAVPDWPNTFGYNLFLYPLKTWLFGPYDILVEHGHRLLGAAVGLTTIALVVALWRREPRAWVRWLGAAALVGVIGQGVLGGLRVQWNERLLAQIHGCTGPLFFALAVALATCTSRRWTSLARARQAGAGKLHRLSAFAALFAFLQIVIGSHLRHVRPDWPTSAFRAAVLFHLVVAAALAAHAGLLWFQVRRMPSDGWLGRPTAWLVGLVALQLALGAGAWLTNYGFPNWFRGYAWAEAYVVEHHGWAQAIVTTAHVAMGSLILAIATLLGLRGWRAYGEDALSGEAGAVRMGVVL
jgi:cytochrome c oxidase assembly protein subunit 15